MFDTTPTDADSFEPRHDGDRYAIDDLDLDPGECRRLDETPHGRSYHLRVGDLFLTVDSDGIRRVSPNAMCFGESHSDTETEPADPGEAFAFLHGDYSADVDTVCPLCGNTGPDYSQYGPDCHCPAPAVVDTIDFPTVPTRAPRALVDGQLVTRPE